jgi:hypothetical protein
LVRISRRYSYFDSLRKYKIYIDNVYCGDIRNGETCEYNLLPGKHQVVAKIDWCRSNIVYIDVNELDKELEVGNSTEGKMFFYGFLYSTVLKNNYLWLYEKMIY